MDELVLSLAFILAFIGASVALLVGIIIFTEVTDAMALTLPTSESGGTPIQLYDEDWQVREVAFFSTHGVTVSWSITPPLLVFSNYANQEQYTFKVFNKTDIIGKNLLVDWEATGYTGNNVNNARLRVTDGSYDRDSFVDFPLPVNVGQPNYVLKGGGLLHESFHTNDISRQTTQFNMTLAGSTLDQVTVMLTQRNGNGGTTVNQNIYSIEIADIAKWEFDSNSSVNMTTGTISDRGLATATMTLAPVAGTPLTAGETQQVEAFNNALSIGFTVIGILPVALFFALFAIFSSLTRPT